MKQQLKQGTMEVACALELTLIDTKEQLEEKGRKVKELQSILSDKENEIHFLKEVLAGRTTLTHHQQNTIVSLQQQITELLQKAEPPVIVMKTYLPEMAEQLSETAI